MKKTMIQFEAGEGRHFSGGVNLLRSTDGAIYAECPVPEDASDDYGYLTLAAAIRSSGADLSAYEFWYDGQEGSLEADAGADCEVYTDIDSDVQNHKSNTVTYGVHLKDNKTGKTTRIDIIDVPEGYTTEDYIKAFEDDRDTDWLRKLSTGTLSLVRLPDCKQYTLPLEIPEDGPQDIV